MFVQCGRLSVSRSQITRAEVPAHACREPSASTLKYEALRSTCTALSPRLPMRVCSRLGGVAVELQSSRPEAPPRKDFLIMKRAHLASLAFMNNLTSTILESVD